VEQIIRHKRRKTYLHAIKSRFLRIKKRGTRKKKKSTNNPERGVPKEGGPKRAEGVGENKGPGIMRRRRVLNVEGGKSEHCNR